MKNNKIEQPTKSTRVFDKLPDTLVAETTDTPLVVPDQHAKFRKSGLTAGHLYLDPNSFDALKFELSQSEWATGKASESIHEKSKMIEFDKLTEMEKENREKEKANRKPKRFAREQPPQPFSAGRNEVIEEQYAKPQRPPVSQLPYRGVKIGGRKQIDPVDTRAQFREYRKPGPNDTRRFRHRVQHDSRLPEGTVRPRRYQRAQDPQTAPVPIKNIVGAKSKPRNNEILGHKMRLQLDYGNDIDEDIEIVFEDEPAPEEEAEYEYEYEYEEEEEKGEKETENPPESKSETQISQETQKPTSTKADNDTKKDNVEEEEEYEEEEYEIEEESEDELELEKRQALMKKNQVEEEEEDNPEGRDRNVYKSGRFGVLRSDGNNTISIPSRDKFVSKFNQSNKDKQIVKHIENDKYEMAMRANVTPVESHPRVYDAKRNRYFEEKPNPLYMRPKKRKMTSSLQAFNKTYVPNYTERVQAKFSNGITAFGPNRIRRQQPPPPPTPEPLVPTRPSAEQPPQ